MASTAQLARAGRGVLGQIWEAVETRNRTVGRVMDKTDPPLQAAPVQPCFPRPPPPPCPGLDAGTHVQAAVSNLQGGEGAQLSSGKGGVRRLPQEPGIQTFCWLLLVNRALPALRTSGLRKA